MEIDLSKPIIRNTLIKLTETGAQRLCPFCIGRMIASVAPGKRLMILRGTHAGQAATISSQPGWSDDEFLVQFDYEKQNTLTRVSYTRDRFCYLPLSGIPNWLCHLSTDDLSALEDSIIHTITNFAGSRGKNDWAANLIPIISTVRRRRLPISGEDIWPTFIAHGFAQHRRPHFIQYFDFANKTLVYLHGRPAIRRKIMPPMSQGRYLTPKQKEYFGPSSGITS